ncbi:DNA polymerase IV [Paenibacillus sp. IB182496]|uniref:DNA polymerase IV n=1 Tax=Paenibacillus sabuli TaxID=2772509 RepID=A0A927BSJ1_9BACL|nr:DNA polymerase IV [Paenibacillus sabuli]MBD2845982.1 DNA polymerase IV [Paenibacillus sabuli]
MPAEAPAPGILHGGRRERTIMLIDGQSFYASVEKAAHPAYRDRPVAVGDPERRAGIILAACPLAKKRGVTTAERLFEALAKCPELVVIRPRMQTYITISLLITEIYESFTELVEPYSIDEQFLDVTGSLGTSGDADALAREIQAKVLLSTGVWSRVGIGPSKILAKMATDNFAKKRAGGVFRFTGDNVETDLWPLPVEQMFMVGSRMTYHFWRMGVRTIGDIARMELGDFQRKLRRAMGRQSDIQAGYYWQTARGIDPSPVVASVREALQSVSHGKALRAGHYRELADIEVVLLELVIEVCRRARRLGRQGRVVSVGAVESDGERSYSFSRQTTLPQATSLTHEVAAAARRLLVAHWRGRPVSRLFISLTQLSGDDTYQLTLFEDRTAAYELERASDTIKARFGDDALMRASSLLEAGVARERAEQIGGHYR